LGCQKTTLNDEKNWLERKHVEIKHEQTFEWLFLHFCDVFIQYDKIVIIYFYYCRLNIALGDILYQKLPKKLQRLVFLRHSNKPIASKGD